jgi:prepilin-type N-terminal cleavage/methylation domain-containing protein
LQGKEEWGMGHISSTITARREVCVTQRTARGLTLIELLVVVGIVATFSSLLIGGFKNFQSGFRASASLSKVESALHYARNLAIANNCVYTVRFENVIHDSTIGTVGSPLGDPKVFQTGSTQPLPTQSIAIYCFPDMATALSITSESLANPVAWNPTNMIANARATAWSSSANYRQGDSVLYSGVIYICSVEVSNKINDPDDTGGGVGITPDTAFNSSTKQHWRAQKIAYTNYLVDRTVLDSDAYFGIQYLSAAPDATVYPLLFFKPDGTASSSMTLFVTDSVQFADDHTTDLTTLNNNRKAFYNTRTFPAGSGQPKKLPWMKMIQVFQGGMIKVRPLTTSAGAANPL